MPRVKRTHFVVPRGGSAPTQVEFEEEISQEEYDRMFLPGVSLGAGQAFISGAGELRDSKGSHKANFILGGPVIFPEES
jgi:hypothetical protein